jgi:NOL1/NOP2/fmu family ribosome biogenesis protein/23S rRNA U2552 (ribose-2'-O)-methylase RlmE/FtsJ
MCPAAVLDARPGDKVLDLCAAPGGKSVQLAARLKGRGVLVSNDASASRCAALIKNLEMAGVTNAIVLNEQPKRLVDTLAEYFDKILIDAPCSGEGMFRRDPEAIKGWTANKPEMCAHTQREILHHAAALLKPGGHMVYSTCTFNPEENEGVIQAFLNAKPDFTLLPVPLTGGMESGRQEWADGTVIIKNTARIWPHRANGEGHFLALLYRKPESSSSVFNTKPAWRIGLRPSADIMKNTFKPFKQFTDNWLRRDFKGHLNFHENTLYLTPDGLPTLRGLRVMRGGWYLGDVRQERFIPSQALAMGLYNDEARYTVELTQQETVRYLKGESFDLSSRANEKTSDKQWTLVCIQGYPLGWGLLSDGRLKNKRPSGWAVEI